MPHPGEKCLAHFELFLQGLAKPGPRVLPIPVCDRPGKPQNSARLLDREAAEQVELSDPGCASVFRAKTGEFVIQRQDEVGIFGEGADLIEQFETDPPASPLQPLPLSGMVDQNPPHGLGSGGEEVSPAVEVLVPDQTQVRLVNQRRAIKGMAGGFSRHACGRELPQFVVDEWKQVSGSLAITGFGGFEEAGHVGHAPECNGPRPQNHMKTRGL